MVQIFDYHSWSNWNLEMLIFEKRGKLEYPEKTFQSKGENEQQTQPTCGTFTPGFEPRQHWWEVIALTTCTILASHTTLLIHGN